jgi:glycosyltransferase involved in cell wall biosynthesis
MLESKRMVSIVIPYYNRPEKLIRCVNSIKNQTYNNYEIIIVDDCSETIFPDLNCDYVYIKNDFNKGPGASRNAGMDVAKGKFIAFLDSDDYWDSKYLEIMVTTFKQSWSQDVAFAYCNTIAFDENNNTQNRRTKRIFQKTILPNILMEGRSWSTSSCLWNFNLIKNVRWDELYNWEDYVFDIKVALKHNEIIPVDLDLVFYDLQGNDKLSKQINSFIIIEKSKALYFIVNCIKNSKFFNEVLRLKLRNLVLSNCIHTHHHVSKPKENYKRNIQSLKSISSAFFVFFAKLGVSLNNIQGIRILNFLKKSI